MAKSNVFWLMSAGTLAVLLGSATAPEATAQHGRLVSRAAKSTPVEAEESAPSQRAPCELLWLDALARVAANDSFCTFDTVVVGVPDPIEAGARLVFDRSLEALASAAAALRYARQGHFLPWKLEAGESGPECHRELPGILRFRAASRNGELARRDLLLLLVGESSVLGPSSAALSKAFALSRAHHLLGYLGPYYSGSARSFANEVRAEGQRRPFASGTVQSRGARTTLAAQGAALFMTGTSERHATAFNFIYGTSDTPTGDATSDQDTEIPLDAGPPPASRPTLSFSQVARAESEPRASAVSEVPNERHLFVISEEGTAYGEFNRDDRVRRYPIPPSLSTLRLAAEADESGRKPALARATLRLPLDRSTQPRDMVRKAAPNAAAALTELSVKSIVEDLDEYGAAEVGLHLTATEDIAFLAARVHAYSPDKRILLFSHDRLLLHPQHALDLDGALVVSSYPSLTQGAGLHTLARESSVGMYWALRWIGESERWRRSLDGPAQEPLEVMNSAVSVLHSGRLWPLSAEKPERLVHTLRSAPVGLWMAWVAWLVSACLSLECLLALRRGAARWPAAHAAPRHPALSFLHAHAMLICQICIATTGALLLAISWPKAGLSDIPEFRLIRVLLGSGCLVSIGGCVVTALEVRDAHLKLREFQRGRLRDLTRWHGLATLALALFLLTIGGFALCGVLDARAGFQQGKLLTDGSLYLARALELGSGVSPVPAMATAAVVAFTLFFVYLSRLRLLDAPAKSDAQGALILQPAAMFGAADRELEELENNLWLAAWFAGDRGYMGALALGLVLPPLWVVLLHPTTLSPGERHFMLENGAQSIAVGLSLLTAYGLIVVRCLHLARLWRQTSRALAGVAATPLYAELVNLRAPLVRNVASMLSSGRSDRSDLRCLRDVFNEAGAALPYVIKDATGEREGGRKRLRAPRARKRKKLRYISQSPAPRSFSPLNPVAPQPGQTVPWTKEFADIAHAAEALRDAHSSRPPALPVTRELALAHLLAFVLGRWIRQFRLVMAPLVVSTLVLLAVVACYPFTPHRLLSSAAMILVLMVVVAGGYVFVSMERNPVLARIGKTSVEGLRLQDHFFRILSWGVVPLVAVFSTYSPETIMLVRRWLEELRP